MTPRPHPRRHRRRSGALSRRAAHAAVDAARMDVVGEAANGVEALALVEQLQPASC